MPQKLRLKSHETEPHSVNEAKYLGIEIGGTKLQLVLGNADARIVRRWRFQVEPAKGGAGIREQILEALPQIRSAGPISSVGVGFGGPVDWRTGKICCSHQIEGWSEFELGAWLQDRTGWPVRIENDANTAALGEARHGAGIGFDPVFYVTLGSGVGGGLVVNGQIYHGAIPGEAEIGHLRLDRNGTIVESRCSGWAVDRRIRRAIEQNPTGTLAKLVGGQTGGEARHLNEALRLGDAAARVVLEETAADLAFALSHVIHLMHPQRILLGGGLSLLGDTLVNAVRQALPQFVMEAFHPGPSIHTARLEEDAVPVGALVLASEKSLR
ncbi:MAG: ROK family protein [Verrucomicrobiota bacterium]